MEDGLLRCRTRENYTSRPTELVLSELGREVACVILAEYADALVIAGVLDEPLTENKLAAAMKKSAQQRRKPWPILSADAGIAGASAPNIPETV